VNTVAEVLVRANGKRLGATLSIPHEAQGIVLFAHGSGSSRHSPRNVYVARSLNTHAIATLLLDLLTDEEDEIDRRTAGLRFDIGLLSQRLSLATRWCRKQPETAKLRIGYFGASTGAGAALRAAATHSEVGAIVSRGGRPDLAGEALAQVTAPTLLIVGERDEAVLDLNRRAAAQLRARHEIAIVADATHLFEEPGALEQVASLAQNWFMRYLSAA